MIPQINSDLGFSGFSLSSKNFRVYCNFSVILRRMRKFDLLGVFVVVFLLFFNTRVESECHGVCDALASYYLWGGTNLTFISKVLNTNITKILFYNPQISNPNIIPQGGRLNVPFKCSCVDDGQFLGHQFNYKIKSGNSYKKISETSYANLTTIDMLTKFNSYDPNNLPDTGVRLNVTVNCSCGNSRVSKDYGLFITYPLRFGENLSLIASVSGLPEKLLSDYNPNSDFSSGSGLVFIPGKDQTGNYPPLKASSSGISGGVIAGVSVAGVVGALFLAACFYFGFYRKKNVEQGLLLQPSFDDHAIEHMHGSGFNSEKMLDSGRHITGSSSTFTGITVDKSVEFSYEELALATNDFSLANKIGQGGFGAVYYGVLRGEKAAIKKMDMQASKEFLAELKVLTHVHHLNLVRLIGYSVESSLFLVYEFIENGNLSEHLRGSSGRGPLSWSSRVQIALDSARGLEYIHEHTVPVYIHRDIKSPNILLDENFRAKVSDFGLTKLTEVGTGSLQTRLVGTFGYMSPEYAQYGDVSPKIDVYAFGVVLYELISAKEAIVKTNEVVTESRGLVALFEEVLNQPNPSKDLRKLVDTRLGDDYPIDSVLKIAQLARACTHENPQLRPSMRSTVVALMTLSSTTEEWDASLFYENQGTLHFGLKYSCLTLDNRSRGMGIRASPAARLSIFSPYDISKCPLVIHLSGRWTIPWTIIKKIKIIYEFKKVSISSHSPI